MVACTETTMKVLGKFGDWSRLKVNAKKSSTFFSLKLDHNVKSQIKHSMAFKEMKKGTIYLGNSLIFGRSKSKEFDRIKDRV